jgi:adenylate cyclase
MLDNRQLSAIMFTDIEGYTALMQRDEQHAVEIRTKHRQIFLEVTDKYNGELIQYYGDGTLSIFRSSVEAIQCAIKMQTEFLKTPSLPVRIGIHVGDIIKTESDIIGDAVNLASQIEALAVPGSILISDKVHDQIRNQNFINVKFLDAFDLKNVDEAVLVFAIANEGLVIPNPKEIKKRQRENFKNETSKTRDKRGLFRIFMISIIIVVAALIYYKFNINADLQKENSIAVLPFENFSTDEDSDIFTDGITEDILTNLSKLKQLHVISRTSVVQYKNTQKSVSEIAKELGVVYILEGSIRKYGDKIRVTAQLINAKNDRHIWADTYDKTITDIFAIQSEVSKEIVEAMQFNISIEDQENLTSIPTNNIDAYQLFLRGRKEADKRTPESITRSIEYYQQAIDLDPNYAEAYAEISNSVFLQTYYGNANPEAAKVKAESYLEKAEKLNNKISRIYTVKGLLYNYSKQYDKAKVAFERAIMLSPNDVTARHQYSTFFYYTENYEKQLEQAEIAYKLDPLSFATASNLFTAYTSTYRYDDAEKLIENIVKNNKESDPFVINRLYMRLYMAKPDYKKAIEPLKFLAKEDVNYSRILGYSYAQIGDTVNAYKVIDVIKALPTHRLQNHRIAVVFAGLSENDSVFYYLDTIRNKSDFFNNNRLYYFDEVKKDPRYQDLLKAHNINSSK